MSAQPTPLTPGPTPAPALTPPPTPTLTGSPQSPPLSATTPAATSGGPVAPTPVAPVTPTHSESVAPLLGFYVTYGTMALLLIALLLGILRGLRGWSLNQALSEDAGNGTLKPSISRLIALLGFAVIICIYLGTGCGVIFRLLAGGNIADLSGLGTFLVGAAALFTPYIANQIKGAVVGVANGPPTPVPVTRL